MVVKKAKTIKKFRWSLIFVFLVVNVFLIFTYKDPDLLAIDSFLVTAILFILAVFHGSEPYGKNNILIFS